MAPAILGCRCNIGQLSATTILGYLGPLFYSTPHQRTSATAGLQLDIWHAPPRKAFLYHGPLLPTAASPLWWCSAWCCSPGGSRPCSSRQSRQRPRRPPPACRPPPQRWPAGRSAWPTASDLQTGNPCNIMGSGGITTQQSRYTSMYGLIAQHVPLL